MMCWNFIELIYGNDVRKLTEMSIVEWIYYAIDYIQDLIVSMVREGNFFNRDDKHAQEWSKISGKWLV